jgi:hypothetical protein
LSGAKIQGAKNPKANYLFFYSGLPHLALTKWGESRRNRNISIAVVNVDVVVDQPMTIEVERATSRTDIMGVVIVLVETKQRLLHRNIMRHKCRS